MGSYSGCKPVAGRVRWVPGKLIKMKHFLGHYDFSISDWSQSEYEYFGESTMDNIQGAIGNPKFTKITDFAADRPTGFITWQFFQVEKSLNFALQVQFKNMFCIA
jgi:hypothetical protein